MNYNNWKHLKEMNVPGVYMIINKSNNKKYIGSSINVRDRIRKHFYDARTKQKKGKKLNYIQRALLKYGEDGFEIVLLERISFPEDCKSETKKKILLQLEQKYLDTYKTYERENGYNILKIAGSTLGYIHSEEEKKRIIENRKPTVFTEQIRKNISIGQKRRFEQETPYWFGKKRSEETIEKIKNTNSTNILQLNLDDVIVNIWRSAREAARELSTDTNKFMNTAIGRCCSGKRKTHKGFKWTYAKDYYRGNIL